MAKLAMLAKNTTVDCCAIFVASRSSRLFVGPHWDWRLKLKVTGLLPAAPLITASSDPSSFFV